MTRSQKSESQKIIILGMDGLDPNLIEKYISESKLPNFKSLKELGGYCRLRTVCPPQSPVIWTSIGTGLLPGEHGIFDFVVRDPKTYKLDLALTKVTPKGIVLTRKGTPLWVWTSKSKIPTVILHFPCTFPPDKLQGRMLSGMGVPDIRGTEGIYSFYTTGEVAEKAPRGKIFYLPKTQTMETTLPGPIDIATKREINLPMRITIKDNSEVRPRVVIELPDEKIELGQGKWSDWCSVTFRITPIKKVHGICRFYLVELAKSRLGGTEVVPDFKLYCSPINFDPREPPFPISYPPDYSKRLAKELGLYYTQGEPWDTKALSDGIMDEATFLDHAKGILREHTDLLFLELNRFESGLLFSYFGYPDVIQHMFWRFIDPERADSNKDLYKDVIRECYEEMDALLGKVMHMIDENTVLMVLSDHGFGAYRRTVSINTWLLENGFLALKEGKKVGCEFFEDVDWSSTRAYSFGFGGIYLNMEGREWQGIVQSNEAENVKLSIIKGLEGLIDPKNGMRVVSKVYTKEEVFCGAYSENAPDLYVGFNRGYRVSWKCALGGVEENIIEDNKSKWSGDHIFDPELVPGVLFMNRKIEVDSPSVIDIAPTILKALDVQIPEVMSGKPL